MGNLASVNKPDILPEFQTFLLDKEKVATTMIYTHVMRKMSGAPERPTDVLWEKGENGY